MSTEPGLSGSRLVIRSLALAPTTPRRASPVSFPFKTTRHPQPVRPTFSLFPPYRASQPCSTPRSRKKRLFSSLLVRSGSLLQHPF